MGNASDVVLRHLKNAKATNHVMSASNAAHDARVSIKQALRAIEAMNRKDASLREMPQYERVAGALLEAQPLADRLSFLVDIAAEDVKYLDKFPHLRWREGKVDSGVTATGDAEGGVING